MAIGAVVLVACCFALSNAINYIEVDTKYGKLRGQITTNSRRFLGVPYATPPIGARRYKMLRARVHLKGGALPPRSLHGAMCGMR